MYVGWEGLSASRAWRFSLFSRFVLTEWGQFGQFGAICVVYSVQYKSSPVAAVQFLIQNSEQTIEGTQKSFARNWFRAVTFVWTLMPFWRYYPASLTWYEGLAEGFENSLFSTRQHSASGKRAYFIKLRGSLRFHAVIYPVDKSFPMAARKNRRKGLLGEDGS